ncbi:MAG: dihydrodipicolinate synthase family protein [Thermoplasmata archaeon]
MTRSSGTSIWNGVLVAITTPFLPDGAIDHATYVNHARWLVEHGVDGLVVAGSLGEGAALSSEERASLVADLAAALPERVTLVAAVGALRTADAVAQARRAATEGARGLLVLPPYVYRGDRAETAAHFGDVFRATDLPCMLYNNPSAYGTDVGPEEVLGLVEEHSSLQAVKESSGDVRRITALRALLGERIEVAVGLDDALLEGVGAGAAGWVAGLANAFPDESVALFDAARRGESGPASELYRWFLPLLRMDSAPKFVQQIKLIESEVGLGPARVRPPRLELAGDERAAVLETLRDGLAHRPAGRGARATASASPVGPRAGLEGADRR